jgi:hypothetical protein
VAARFQGLLVRIPQGPWMSLYVCVMCFRRGLCDGPISRPEESCLVYVLLSGISCNSNLLHLQGIGIKRSG